MPLPIPPRTIRIVQEGPQYAVVASDLTLVSHFDDWTDALDMASEFAEYYGCELYISERAAATICEHVA